MTKEDVFGLKIFGIGKVDGTVVKLHFRIPILRNSFQLVPPLDLFRMIEAELYLANLAYKGKDS